MTDHPDNVKLAMRDDLRERAEEGDRIIAELRRDMTKGDVVPRWDETGDPITLGAAATDALTWLEWMRDRLASDTTMKLDQARANLARCAGRLRERLNSALPNALLSEPLANASKKDGPSVSRDR